MGFMISGRWDVTVQGLRREYASWFEFTDEGGTITGNFVGIEGSVRPMAEVGFDGDELYFRLPSQYEKHAGDLVFRGRLVDERIEGEANDEEENWIGFSAVPAPSLSYKDGVEWGEPVNLIQGDLDNWELRYPEGT